jgi:hypothetical protein
MTSPDLESLERWKARVSRVEKPWGYELIWALTGDYCGKLLFIEAGRPLVVAPAASS